MTFDLTTLKAAVEQVRKETGEQWVSASVNYGGLPTIEGTGCAIHVGAKTYRGLTLDEAAQRAIEGVKAGKCCKCGLLVEPEQGEDSYCADCRKWLNTPAFV